MLVLFFGQQVWQRRLRLYTRNYIRGGPDQHHVINISNCRTLILNNNLNQMQTVQEACTNWPEHKALIFSIPTITKLGFEPNNKIK